VATITSLLLLMTSLDLLGHYFCLARMILSKPLPNLPMYIKTNFLKKLSLLEVIMVVNLLIIALKTIVTSLAFHTIFRVLELLNKMV